MSEMVERVAKAIKAELGRQMDARPLVDSQPGDWHASGGAIDLEALARAAVAAMKEPTDSNRQAVTIQTTTSASGRLEIVVTSEMVDAGYEEWAEHGRTEDIRYVLECVFRAMAYVALAESEAAKNKENAALK